jgi:hypothetical protein
MQMGMNRMAQMGRCVWGKGYTRGRRMLNREGEEGRKGERGRHGGKEREAQGDRGG